ncbi:MAG: DUF2132 domain-containing protein [Flavobacteriales bacterium]|nr:DUF2132 domain-containing protein [Flavobacteriales bacterium]
MENTSKEQPNNPLHGVKLATMLRELVDHYGWQYLAMRVNVNCFKNNPSIGSSLKFLRRESWAKAKVQQLYSELKKEA